MQFVYSTGYYEVLKIFPSSDTTSSLFIVMDINQPVKKINGLIFSSIFAFTSKYTFEKVSTGFIMHLKTF